MNFRKLAVVKVSILIVLLAASLSSGTTYVVFRYDDFSADKPGVRKTNVLRKEIWESEQKMDALFEKYGDSYVIAARPITKDDYIGAISEDQAVLLGEDNEKTEFLKRGISEGRIEIAQHGFTHTNHANPHHRPGEFIQRDYESQFQDIARGREILLEALGLTDINTFAPPWNAWNRETAKVLKKLGFHILSADCYYYYKSVEGLTAIPFTAVPEELEQMLTHGTLRDDSVAVVLYHPFEIVRSSGGLNSYYFGLERLEKLLQKLSTMPEIKVVTFQQLAGEDIDLTAKKYYMANLLACMQSFWTKLLPANLLAGASRQSLYVSMGDYSRILWFWGSVTLIFVTVVFVVGFLVFFLFVKRLPAKWVFRASILAILLFCLSAAAELRLMQRGYHITGIRMVPGLLAAGFLFGLLLYIMKKTLRRGSVTNKV